MFGFFVVFRVLLLGLWFWVVKSIPATQGVHMLSFFAGMALLSLLSDEKIKRWFVLPEPPRTMRVPPHDPTCKDLIVHMGSDEEFQEHFSDPLDEERILMAAIRHLENGQIWAVEQPGRHHHVCWAMDMLCVHQSNMTDQGFLTSYGRYVDRKEAAAIAVSANQLLDKNREPTILFSEDVWKTPPWEQDDHQQQHPDRLLEPAVGADDTAWGLEDLHQCGAPEGVGVVQCGAADADRRERVRAS